MKDPSHRPGDLVDIWYDLPNEDAPGWRGPAQIATVIEGEGDLTVRSQGKTSDRRRQEVRIHVAYLVDLPSVVHSRSHQWNIVGREVKSSSASFTTLDVVFQQYGWHIGQRIRNYDGRRSLDVAFAFASQLLHLDHVVAARVCRGVATMFAVSQYYSSGVLAWCRGGGANSVVYYTPEGTDVARYFAAKAITYMSLRV